MIVQAHVRLLHCALLGAVGLGLIQACFNDYDQFDLNGVQRGGRSSGGALAAGSSGEQTAGQVSAAGSSALPGGGGTTGGGGIGVIGGGGTGATGALATAGALAGGGGSSPAGGDAGLGGTANAGGAGGSAGTGDAGIPGGGAEVAGAGGAGNVAGVAGSEPISGAGGAGNTAGAALSGSGGAGNTAGAAGSSGTDGCGAGEKLCDTECVATEDPQFGCAGPSCDACDLPNATAACAAGACAVGSCDPGYLDCDTEAGTGCEHTLTTPSNSHCGGCDNSCTRQGDVEEGGFTCSNLRCRCTTAPQCRIGNAAAFECDGNGYCVCGGQQCERGEVCIRSGPDTVCSCNGAVACADGMVCCETPDGCFDLQWDFSNCGACGWQCPAGTGCVDGVCQ